MQKHFGQKIALSIAVLCYLSAIGVFVGLFMLPADTEVPIRGSFMASTVFFISCGIVLQVIGRARLKGIISGDSSS
ncbi:MAG: hypothetical protein WCX90_03295 [Thiohalomonadaceae bacterium]